MSTQSCVPSRTARYYQITVEGKIDPSWSDWLGGLAIIHTDQGETVLTGSVRDQSVLYGLLERLNDLGMQLSSFTTTIEDQNPAVDSDKGSHQKTD